MWGRHRGRNADTDRASGFLGHLSGDLSTRFPRPITLSTDGIRGIRLGTEAAFGLRSVRNDANVGLLGRS